MSLVRNSNRYYVRPIFSKIKTKDSLFLGSSKLFFNEIELITRGKTKTRSKFLKINEIKYLEPDIQRDINKRISNITKKRKKLGKFNFERSLVMGILNVTPDSFFDGGKYLLHDNAIEQFKKLIKEGADIIDIGGESTRPGAEAISRNQELARVLPPITGLSRQNIKISVDTRHAEVMTRACAAGATIINDVEALRRDGAVGAAAASGVPVIIMHMQGQPETMQDAPHYDFAPVDVYQFLEERIKVAMVAGIAKPHIAIDPGFGFGKTVAHNLQILKWLSLFHGLGVPILFGASRKSTIAKLSKGEPAEQRLAGSLALAMAAYRQGAQILRVHDVAETVQALAIEQALLQSE